MKQPKHRKNGMSVFKSYGYSWSLYKSYEWKRVIVVGNNVKRNLFNNNEGTIHEIRISLFSPK